MRIWKEGDGHGKEGESYHSKRMQRYAFFFDHWVFSIRETPLTQLDSVLSVMYTSDARFVLSASDDANIRLWKANPHERLGVLDTRERNAIEYREALKQRWRFDEEVGKVLR